MISSIWDSFWSHNEGVEPTPLKILPFPGQEGRLRSGHMGIWSGGLLRFGFPKHYWGSSKLREAKSKSPLNSIKPLFFEMVAKAQWMYSLKFSRRADYFMTVVSWCNILNQISVLVKHSEVWLVILLKKWDFSDGFKPCWNVMVVVLSVLHCSFRCHFQKDLSVNRIRPPWLSIGTDPHIWPYKWGCC